jgi:HSP20 family molecular chaperone IbpA
MKFKKNIKTILTFSVLLLLLLSFTLIATSKTEKNKEALIIKDAENALKDLNSNKINKTEALKKLKKAISVLESKKRKNQDSRVNLFSNNIDSFDSLDDIDKIEKYMNRLFQQSMISSNLGSFNMNMNFPTLNGLNMNFKSLNVNNALNIQTEEKDKYFLVKVDMPNVKNNNLKVVLKDNLLTISGTITKKEIQKDDKGNIISQQQYSSNFTRSLTLPSPVKNSGMSTDLKGDTLVIKILKDL